MLTHSYPGLWTLFAMLGASCLVMALLWYKLGGSSEYRGSVVDNVPEKTVADDEEATEEKKSTGVVKVHELA